MTFIFIIICLSFLPNFIHTSVPFQLNPGCNEPQCKDFNNPAIFYANHPVGDSLIHLIYSSLDELTITIAETAKNVLPTFNYPALFARNYTGAIQFGEVKPNNSFSLVFRRLIEFNDSNDNGKMDDNDNATYSYPLTNIPTSNMTFQNRTTSQPTFNIDLPLMNGTATLNIDVVYPGEGMRDSKFPRLKTGSKSYFVNIALNASNYTEPNTRFAFEFYLISPGINGAEMSSSRFIDDQYTPGIFNVWQLHTLSKLYPFSLLWKPVVYLTDERTIEDNTLMQVYPLNDSLTLEPDDQGIYYSFLKKANVTAFTLSLGQAEDGFFAKTNYTFIQLTAGLDLLEADSTAQFVTIALIVSLALPALVAIIALIVVLKRRFSRPTPSSYDTIDE